MCTVEFGRLSCIFKDVKAQRQVWLNATCHEALFLLDALQLSQLQCCSINWHPASWLACRILPLGNKIGVHLSIPKYYVRPSLCLLKAYQQHYRLPAIWTMIIYYFDRACSRPLMAMCDVGIQCLTETMKRSIVVLKSVYPPFTLFR